MAVVCAAFDPATDAEVLRYRDIVRSCGAGLPDRPRHRPHITLGAARVEDPADVTAVMDTVAAGAPAFALLLDVVSVFEQSGTIWLGASNSNRLGSLHRAVDAALLGAGHARAFGDRSDPVAWIAHCTLATRLTEPLLARASRAVAEGFTPIPARVTALATILVGGEGDVGYRPLAG